VTHRLRRKPEIWGGVELSLKSYMLISIATWDRKRARVRPCVPCVYRPYRVMYRVSVPAPSPPPGAPPDLSKREPPYTVHECEGTPCGVRWGALKVVVQ
jgi:hypothetical protein